MTGFTRDDLAELHRQKNARTMPDCLRACHAVDAESAAHAALIGERQRRFDAAWDKALNHGAMSCFDGLHDAAFDAACAACAPEGALPPCDTTTAVSDEVRSIWRVLAGFGLALAAALLLAHWAACESGACS